MFAFTAIEEAARAAGLAKFAEGFPIAPSEQLMDVTLMGNVEYELIRGCLENTVQRDLEFYHA